jgi:hypothetical protein
MWLAHYYCVCVARVGVGKCQVRFHLIFSLSFLLALHGGLAVQQQQTLSGNLIYTPALSPAVYFSLFVSYIDIYIFEKNKKPSVQHIKLLRAAPPLNSLGNRAERTTATKLDF